MGITNAGQIVGSFKDELGVHGFVATPTPVPEPASVLPIAQILGAGAFVRKRAGV